MIKKISIYFLIFVISLPLGLISKISSVQADDWSLENYRNSATQISPASPLLLATDQSNNTGAVFAQIKISVPAGRQGVEPQLSLHYSSQAKNGVAGMGWNLDLGKIYRSSKKGQPSYNSDDVFYSTSIGSGELAATAIVGEYREKLLQDFSKFVYSNDAWLVHDKSGVKYYFGSNSASRQAGVGGTYAWQLDKIEDLFGNYLTISYLSDGNALYPNEIRYTGNSQSGLSPAGLVKFYYGGRGDNYSDYSSGLLTNFSKKLDKIEVKWDNQLVRKYVFNYENTSVDQPLLRLQSVVEYGNDGLASLPAVSFSYQTVTPNFPNNYNWSQNLPAVFIYQQLDNGIISSLDKGWRMVDLNRDGLLDMILGFLYLDNYGTTVYTNKVFINNGQTWTESQQWKNVPFAFIIHREHRNQGGSLFKGWYEDSGFRLNDINGDGLVDLIQSKRTLKVKDAGCGSNQTLDEVLVYLNTGTDWVRDSYWESQLAATEIFINQVIEYSYVDDCKPVKAYNEDIGTRLVDINNDGLIDIIRAEDYYYPVNQNEHIRRAYLNTGHGWQLDNNWSQALPEYFNTRIIHGNGPYDNREVKDLGVRLADINNDGLVDIVRSYLFTNHSVNGYPCSFNNYETKSVYLNTGHGWTSNGTNSWLNTLGVYFSQYVRDQYDTHWSEDTGARLEDINGDGLVDLVYARDISWNGQVSNNRYVAINNGQQWVRNVSWENIFPSPLIETNIVCQTYSFYQYTRENKDKGLRLGDVNGDGLSDFSWSYMTAAGNLNKGVYLNTGQLNTSPYLLKRIDNGLGGIIEYDYLPSTKYNNVSSYEGSPNLPQLGMVIPILSQRREIDRGVNTSVYNYGYSQGVYDYPDREWRGFHPISTTYVDGSRIWRYYIREDNRKGWLYYVHYLDSNGKYVLSEAKNVTSTPAFVDSYFPHYWREIKYSYNLDDQTDIKTHLVNYEYDDYGNISQIFDHGEYYKSGQTEYEIPGDERIVNNQYVYNLGNYLVNKLARTESLDHNNQKIAESKYYYDNHSNITDLPILGNLTKKEYWLDQGGFDPYEHYVYDSYGNVIEAYDANNNKTAIVYESNYQIYPQSVANAKNQVEQYSFDPRYGNILATTDINGHVTNNQYDVFGRLSRVIRPYDSSYHPTEVYNYDLSSRPIKVSKEARTLPGTDQNLITHSFYDGFGRLLQTKVEAENNQGLVSQVFSYNDRGAVEKSWLPYYSVIADSYTAPGPSRPYISHSYDVLGRVINTIYPDDSQESKSYDRWTVASIDRNNHQKVYDYDAFGQIKTVREINGGQDYLTRYIYDDLSRLTNITDAENNQTEIVYDSLSRKLSVNDPDMGLWTYVYDNNGNLLRQTDARGTIINFQYDSLNRVIRKDYTSGTDIVYTYDDPAVDNSLGQLTRVQDRSGSTIFAYDNRGREIGQQRFIRQQDLSISKTYDSMDRLQSLTYPDGEIVNFSYNLQGQLKRLVGDEVYVDQADYNAAGQLSSMVYGNGAAMAYTYEPDTLRLSSLQTISSGQILQNLTYGYDSVANVLSITDGINQHDQSFIYDDLDRLVSASGFYGNFNYNYDALGNILNKEGVSYSYDPDKAHAVISTSAGFSAQYDANGNMIRRSGRILEYDEDNRLIREHDLSSNDSNGYIYDWQGNRVIKNRKETINYCDPVLPEELPKQDSSGSVNNGEPEIKLEPLPEIKSRILSESTFGLSKIDSAIIREQDDGWAEKDLLTLPLQNCKTISIKKSTIYFGNLWEKEDNTVRKHYYFNNQKIASRENTSTITFFHNDHLQSTSLTTNSSGQSLGLTEYKPYGGMTIDQNTSTDYKYNGKELDTETGLYYYGARYYDPVIGRFISADSLVPNYIDPQSLNRYSYVMNNPMKYVDPSGHAAQQSTFNNMVNQLVRIPGALILGFAIGYVAGRAAVSSHPEASISVLVGGVDAGLHYWHTGDIKGTMEIIGETALSAGISYGQDIVASVTAFRKSETYSDGKVQLRSKVTNRFLPGTYNIPGGKSSMTMINGGMDIFANTIFPDTLPDSFNDFMIGIINQSQQSTTQTQPACQWDGTSQNNNQSGQSSQNSSGQKSDSSQPTSSTTSSSPSSGASDAYTTWVNAISQYNQAQGQSNILSY